jgi:hypothetical protein
VVTGRSAGRSYPVVMSTLRDPVGPQPKKVYWRRRILLLLGVVAVVVVVLLIVFRPTSPPAPAGTDAPAAESPAGGQASQTPASGEEQACAADQLTLLPVTDQDAYDPGVEPQLSWTLENTGAQPCTLNVGTSQQVFKVTSGDEVIWSSADCQSDAADFPMTLKPGADPVASSTIPWDRTRSSADTCSAEQREPVDAGGASYHLEITVGGVEATDTKQFLLN